MINPAAFVTKACVRLCGSQAFFPSRTQIVVCCLGLLAGTLPCYSAPADAPFEVELNKLEPLTQDGGGCRLYFLVSTHDANPVPELRLEMFIFGTDGVIARRVGVDLGPLKPNKTVVRAFDLQGLTCENFGRILINSVLACDVGGTGLKADQQREACLDRLVLSSHTKVAIAK